MFTPGTENQWEVAFHPDYAPEVLEVSDAVRRDIYSLVGLLRKLGPTRQATSRYPEGIEAREYERDSFPPDSGV
jgi:hypothetical protein